MVHPFCSPKKKSGSVLYFLLETSVSLALAHLMQTLLLWSSSFFKLSALLTSTWEIREHDGPHNKTNLEEIFHMQLTGKLALFKVSSSPIVLQNLSFMVLTFSYAHSALLLHFFRMHSFSFSTQNVTYVLWTDCGSTCGLQSQTAGLAVSVIS